MLFYSPGWRVEVLLGQTTTDSTSTVPQYEYHTNVSEKPGVRVHESQGAIHVSIFVVVSLSTSVHPSLQ